MSQKFEINAQLREQSGTGIMRRLRRVEDRIPAIIYGGGDASESISISHQEMKLALENEAIFSHILRLKIDGKPQQVVLKNVQRHAYKPRILHVDFQRILASEKMHVTVPFHFINEELSPGIKAGGILSHHLTEIEVICLPKDLPESITIDLGQLEVGDALHLSNLKLPENVVLASGTLSELDEKHNKTIVSIHLHRGASIEETTPAIEEQANVSKEETKG
jgi:large subunit ribosomal protein L25